MRRPCLDCGTPYQIRGGQSSLGGEGSPTSTGSRRTRTPYGKCPACSTSQLERDRQRRGARQHYGGDYRTKSKKLRGEGGVCWLCGTGPDPRLGNLQADHVIPSDPNSELMLAHQWCNGHRGNARTPR